MKRSLTPEEKKLWEHVAAKAMPLRKRARIKHKTPEVKKNKAVSINPLPIGIKHMPLAAKPALGAYANIDRNTAERFRKGHYPIDATLDLHGMSSDKAQAALHRFLCSHYERGNRCLLVVTGKGLVLREALPQWLTESELQPVILTFDVAKQKHGGAGAYYVLLRRKRRGKE